MGAVPAIHTPPEAEEKLRPMNVGFISVGGEADQLRIVRLPLAGSPLSRRRSR